MKVVILCGGKGTRIRDVSESIPKPMLPIGGRPIVWHIMKSYAAHGHREFVLCLGYRGWLIKEFFLNYTYMTADITLKLRNERAVAIHDGTLADDWKVTLVDTGEETMTGGRVVAARRHLEGEEPFMLTYGDGVADIDIGALERFHRAHGRIATVTAVHPPSRFGEMDVDDGRVRTFNEKPQASEGLINGGFMVLDGRRLWPYLGDRPDAVLEREPMRRLSADGEMMAYRHTGFWQPMDTPREFALLNELWEAGRAPWMVWGGGDGRHE